MLHAIALTLILTCVAVFALFALFLAVMFVGGVLVLLSAIVEVLWPWYQQWRGKLFGGALSR